MRNKAFFGEITRINISLLQDIRFLLQLFLEKVTEQITRINISLGQNIHFLAQSMSSRETRIFDAG